LQYSLALAEHGLCDGPPSPVTIVNRLELVEAYEEAWRTFSWSKHLTLDLPPPHQAPYVSGGTLVLPIYDIGGVVRSFVVQSIPSPLRGVPERHSRIDFDFVVRCFIVDGTQDLLAVVPRHDGAPMRFVSSLSLSCAYTHESSLPCSVLVRALSTGRPHPLSANGGILHSEASQYPFSGCSKHEISGDFLGMITFRNEEPEYRLLIWDWKTGVLHVNMRVVRVLPRSFIVNPLIKLTSS